jgi:hypothetical protein
MLSDVLIELEADAELEAVVAAERPSITAASGST